MIYITDEEIKQIKFNSFELLDIVNDTIKHKRETILPPKTSIKLDGGKFYNTMPCIISSINAGGGKIS